MIWRGAAERDAFLHGETMVVAGHRADKAIVHPICAAAARRGRALVNWVAEIDVGTSSSYQQED